jgi:plastocyanin
MQSRRVGFSLVLVLLSTCGSLYANTLQGTFTFHRKAPDVALVYFSEDTNLSPDVVPVIDQKEKAFTPQLVAGTKGSKVIFQNSDSISHNIFADDMEANVKFDVGLIDAGGNASHDITWGNTVVRANCKIHPTMRTWIASIASKYYKVIDFEKNSNALSFEMNAFPESLSEVSVWLPGYEPLKTAIRKGESKTLELKKRDKVVGALTLSRK